MRGHRKHESHKITKIKQCKLSIVKLSFLSSFHALCLNLINIQRKGKDRVLWYTSAFLNHYVDQFDKQKKRGDIKYLI